MAKRNFNGTQINQSVTIVEQAGADIEDVRNKIVTYDENGNAILAADGSTIPIGIALIEAGANDISGELSGSVAEGEDIDIQIKDIGYVLAGGEITKGADIAASEGLAVAAEAGDYVLGIALSNADEGDYCRVQISKYQKAQATE